MRNWRRIIQRAKSKIVVGLILLVSGVYLLVSLFLRSRNQCEWLSDVLLNLGFLGLGILAAYWIGERLIEGAEQRRWNAVDQAIERRAIRAAMTVLGGFVDAPTIRTQLKLASPSLQIPAYRDLVSNPIQALEFSRKHLLPALVQYTGLKPPPQHFSDFTGFSSEDWTAITTSIERTSFSTALTIMLFGQRPAPALRAAIIDLDDRILRCSDLLSGWSTQRSGQGEMDYQGRLLEHFEGVAKSAQGVLQALVDKRTDAE